MEQRNLLSGNEDASQPALRIHERRRHHATLVVLSLLTAAVAWREWSLHGTTVALWDWMLLSGLLVFLAGATAAYSLPRRLEATLARLARREVLVATETPLQEMTAALRRDRRRWRFYGGLVCSLAIALAFAAVLITNYSSAQLALGILETVIAFSAGRYLGAMAQSSMLWRALRRHKVTLKVRPAALDGAGGLEALGHFFFLQASVVSLPAVYISAWLLLIPVFPRYEAWILPYCGLLLVAIAFTVAAFLLPLWSFHREMARQKEAYAPRADEIAQRINALKDELLAAADDREARSRLRGEIDAETRLYREIEAMPVWPIARATGRRFTINNTVLTFPLIARGLEQLGIGGDILRWLGTQLSA